MPSPQGLQPVLKMKVDELFLNWLSEPSIQEMLKGYLRKIKNGDELEFEKGNSNFTENNNIAPNCNVTERTSASLSAPCSPPSATLPSGSGSSNRAGPNSRALRRSVSVKKVLFWLCNNCCVFPIFCCDIGSMCSKLVTLY
ncbi:serine/threonine-protein phosphatase 2A regulatory subunit B'' subunit beta isoform X1 [Tachysurus ichikawai]